MGRPRHHVKRNVPDYAEGTQVKTEDPDERFNNALARGLAVLRAFQLDRPLLGNLELAQITGLARPTVSRLTFTLHQLGYLAHREEFGKYELAAGVVGLAYPYLARQSVPPLARSLMVELAQSTQTNVGLGVQEDLSVYYLEYALGEPNPNRLQRAGFRVPLVRTAMGRACVAGMAPAARERLYQHMARYYGRSWSALRVALDEAIAQVQADGYCVAMGSFNADTHAVAVPFALPGGHTVLAFNSQGHATRLPPKVLGKNGRKLLALAQEVRRRLAEHPATPSLGQA